MKLMHYAIVNYRGGFMLEQVVLDHADISERHIRRWHSKGGLAMKEFMIEPDLEIDGEAIRARVLRSFLSRDANKHHKEYTIKIAMLAARGRVPL